MRNKDYHGKKAIKIIPNITGKFTRQYEIKSILKCAKQNRIFFEKISGLRKYYRFEKKLVFN